MELIIAARPGTRAARVNNKGLFSSWFFVRAYGVLVLGIITVALLLDALLYQFTARDDEQDVLATYSPLVTLLQTELQAVPSEQQAARLAALSQGWEIDVRLLMLDDFAGLPELTTELETGALQLFYDTSSAPTLYQRLPDTGTVLSLGPLPAAAPRTTREITVIAIYYALISLVLALWIWPFYRDLSLLRRAAADFGREDFSTRVHLNSKSSILPVAQAFNTMAERIETLVSAHKELTHAVSHELRTPLARFKFSMEMLARNLDAEKKQRYLDNMKGDVTELETLIDEMLSYARLSEQNLLLNLVEIDIKQWLQQEIAAYANETIKVTCGYSAQTPNGDCRVTCNPDLLARAVHNIVRNGLRYASHTIAVHAHLSQDTVLIRICDDGPGIPDNKREAIFEPFSRLETSRDKKSGGYGLGLAIAARIMQRHKGRIWVDNCEPHGACFKLEWPRRV